MRPFAICTPPKTVIQLAVVTSQKNLDSEHTQEYARSADRRCAAGADALAMVER
jgi:hypothetical protein